MHMDLDETINSAVATAVRIRHRLHRIPELGYEEFKTAAAIREELDALGIAHVDGVPDAPTATIAHLGDPSKPCVALRADIDALPIVERTGVEYASQHAGVMHACGHDGHSAMLIGAAAVIKEIAAQLPVCVKFLWQPAEEGGGGARRLIDAGALGEAGPDGAAIGPRASAIFGLHGWPTLPIGSVSTRPGPILAASDSFRVDFIGRGAHGAFPHLGRDPIVAACSAVLDLQQIVSREIDPTDSAVVTVAMMRAGTATNIIPDVATIEGTARTLNDGTRDVLRAALVRRCQAIAAAGDCRADVRYFDGYPPTINDPASADFVARVANESLGPTAYIPAGRPSMGGEDFAYYLQKIPGCFFFIGVAPPGGVFPPLHSDSYNFSDAAMPVGVRMMVDLTRKFMG
jgi:amidohydrolase